MGSGACSIGNVTRDETLPSAGLPVNHHVVRRVVSNHGTDFLGDGFDFRVSTDDPIFFRDVAHVEELFSGEDRILVREEWVDP
jgi:hypothetical protein